MAERVVTEEVSFDVTISAGGLFGGLLGGTPTHCTVQGYLYRLASARDCTNSVLLLLHGVSQGRYVWDFPMQPDLFSPARLLAAAGYPVIAIARLGYPSSDRPSGRSLTVQAHADVITQVVGALRSGRYREGPGLAFRHVGLLGHSMGTQIAVVYAGQPSAAIDVLIATGWSHSLSPALTAAIPGETARAISSPYFYFGGTAENRERLFYDARFADAALVAKETSLARLTPSGEVLSTLAGQSRVARAEVRVPLLLILAEEDLLFPASQGDFELAGYTLSPDRTLIRVPDAGHVFFLHPPPAGPEVTRSIIRWLKEHSAELPACKRFRHAQVPAWVL